MGKEEKAVITIWYIVIAVAVAAFISMLSSCTPTRYVTYREHSTDTVYQSKIVHDSVDNFVHDSVWIQIKGDTVTQYRYKYNYKYKYINKTDTLYKAKTDTIYRTVIQEKKKTLKDKITDGIADIAILLIIGITIYLILRRILR